MKKVLFFLASMLVLAACENYYIDKHLGGSDFNPTDIRSIDYTLKDADYQTIVSSEINNNKALSLCVAADTIVTEDTTIYVQEDSTAYEAFLLIADTMAFSSIEQAELYIPAFLNSYFPQWSNGSLVNVTYNKMEADSIAKVTSTYSLVKNVWGSTIYYKQAIKGEGQGKLVIQDVVIDPTLSYIWKYDDRYGMKASAHLSGTNYPSESWVVTPAIDLKRATNPMVKFEQARKYGVEFVEECFVMVSTNYVDDVTKCDWKHIPFNKDDKGYIVPDGTNWDFMSTGELDLSEFAGQDIYIGFKYTSTADGAATWEFKNLVVGESEE